MNFKRLSLYFNTVKYLSFKQFIFNFVRRLLNKNKFIDITDVACNQLKLISSIQYNNKIDAESVCFLNERRSFEYISNWACMDEPKLWRYNLHYFDYLLDDGASEQVKDKIIDEWIKASYSLKEDAWEPYPVSLRLVNWIKYFILHKNNNIPEAWLKSLYQQAPKKHDFLWPARPYVQVRVSPGKHEDCVYCLPDDLTIFQKASLSCSRYDNR